MVFLYISFLFATFTDQVQLVVGVAATLRAPDLSVSSSDAALKNGLESPASAEDEEEDEDELLDPGADQPQATMGFLPPMANVQKTVPSTAAVTQQMSKSPQHQPEELFHFSPPRQRKQFPFRAKAAQVRFPASLPSAGLVAAVDGTRPASEAQAAILSSESDKSQMGLVSTNVHLADSKPKIPWPPPENAYAVCSPPCIHGRGICNDNVCFCKEGFDGSTCHHKTVGAFQYRATRVMVVGVCVVCAVFGFLIARLVNVYFQGSSERRLQYYGQGKVKIEKWAPPQGEGKHVQVDG